MHEAASALLMLGPVSQKYEYGLWLESARACMTCDQLAALDDVRKLDLSNDVQLQIMHSAFHHNMAAINFWLNSCVLLRETMQFPNRLVANAFNLSDNAQKQVVGFAGTKDNSLLLPLQVSQRSPIGASELLATDGKMCALVLTNTKVVPIAAHANATGTFVLSDETLRLAIERGADALIDAGAAMSGLTNVQVATRVARMLPESSRLQGVVYFEPKEATWFVLSRSGRSWPQSSSPIHERDAFVYFDESRCRGADMKLLSDAKAVLTIGLGMGKAKLMQAAGRMRKLDRRQSILFAVPPELVPKICDADHDNLTSLGLLKWVLRNTIQATADGFSVYASQGSHFCMTMSPELRLLDENLRLVHLYGGA
eukprot:3046715-Pleurochrysis_carterae.AAC.1